MPVVDKYLVPGYGDVWRRDLIYEPFFVSGIIVNSFVSLPGEHQTFDQGAEINFPCVL